MKTLVLVAAAAVCLFSTVARSVDSGEDNVKFAPKNFYDYAESVGISGTLTGTDLGYKTNTYAVTCIKELNQCIVASIQAVGDNQVGQLDYPYLIPIVKWNDYEVVAQEEMQLFSCGRITFTISRKDKTALWVEEPVNRTKPACSKSDGKYHKYTIEDPPYWKKMNSKR